MLGRRRRKGKNKKTDASSSSSSEPSTSKTKVDGQRRLLEMGEEEIDLEIDSKGKEFDAVLFGKTLQKGFTKLFNDSLLSDITLVLVSPPDDNQHDDPQDGEKEKKKAKCKDETRDKDKGTSSGDDGKEKILAHRMVLVTWSDIFRGMLSHNWKESTQSELEIQVALADRAHFHNMFRYSSIIN